MAAWLSLASVLAVLVAVATAHKNFTVTEEVWFDVEIKDNDGIGEDYRGRFVVAVFGDKCPMTCMNFQSLAKGYKRGTVSLLSHNFTLLCIVFLNLSINMPFFFFNVSHFKFKLTANSVDKK